MKLFIKNNELYGLFESDIDNTYKISLFNNETFLDFVEDGNGYQYESLIELPRLIFTSSTESTGLLGKVSYRKIYIGHENVDQLEMSVGNSNWAELTKVLEDDTIRLDKLHGFPKHFTYEGKIKLRQTIDTDGIIYGVQYGGMLILLSNA